MCSHKCVCCVLCRCASYRLVSSLTFFVSGTLSVSRQEACLASTSCTLYTHCHQRECGRGGRWRAESETVTTQTCVGTGCVSCFVLRVALVRSLSSHLCLCCVLCRCASHCRCRRSPFCVGDVECVVSKSLPATFGASQRWVPSLSSHHTAVWKKGTKCSGERAGLV